MRPQHLKDLLAEQNEVSKRLCTALASLGKLVLSGKLPESIRPVFYGGSLTALKKKDGGIRPIAVGNTLRRLIAKVVSKREQLSAGARLRPVQVGRGTRSGAEAAVHATRFFLDQCGNITQLLLKLDFTNAFNTLSRSTMLKAVKEFLPDYYLFIWQCYCKHSYLFYGDQIISSECGVQQRDPLGPMLFSLTTLPLVKSLISRLNIWYLDDNIIGGEPQVVIADLHTVKDSAASYGLHLNLSKCEAHITGGGADERSFARDSLKIVAPNIQVTDRARLELLGSPLSVEAMGPCLEDKVSSAQRLTSRLSVLQAHQALFLLKNCLSIFKLLYVLRSSPAWTQPEHLVKFDEVIRTSAQRITNCKMEGDVWRQATFPVSMGGIGLRLASELALPAYLSSVCFVRTLVLEMLEVNIACVLDTPVKKWTTLTTLEPPLEETRSIQKAWDLPLVNMIHRKLMESTKDTINKARILASSQRESGSWLNALPSPSVGNLLDNDTLRISVGLRLGAPLCHSHQCICGSQVDVFGRHGLCCKKSMGRFSRHSAINDTVFLSLQSIGYSPILEPPGVSRSDGKRPDGLTRIPWKEGNKCIGDSTCVDICAASHVQTTSISPGAAAADAEQRKRVKYSSLTNRFVFVPLGFETFGPWGPEAKRFVGIVGRKLSEKTGETRATEFLKQRLSMAIQRGNSASVLGTLPRARTLDEIYYVLSVE